MLLAALFGQGNLPLPFGETRAVIIGAFGIASGARHALNEMG
jgi:hypothetical protein